MVRLRYEWFLSGCVGAFYRFPWGFAMKGAASFLDDNLVSTYLVQALNYTQVVTQLL